MPPATADDVAFGPDGHLVDEFCVEDPVGVEWSSGHVFRRLEPGEDVCFSGGESDRLDRLDVVPILQTLDRTVHGRHVQVCPRPKELAPHAVAPG